MKKIFVLMLSAFLAVGLAACERQDSDQQPPAAPSDHNQQNTPALQTTPRMSAPSRPVAPSPEPSAQDADQHPPVATPSTPAAPDESEQSTGNT